MDQSKNKIVFSETVQAYAEHSRDKALDLDATIFRTGSLDARDIVAAQASDGQMDTRSIRDLARRMRGGARAGDLVQWKALEPSPLIRLARIMALQNEWPDDRIAAVDIFAMVIRHHGRRHVPRAYMKVFAECALEMRDYSTAKEIAERFPDGLVERLTLLTDLANPFVKSPYADMGVWLDGFNRFFESSGVEPINLASALEPAPWKDPSPFGLLSADLEAGTTDGPLVTVAMSTWCPDNTLFTSVNSLLRQTWRNLEILVIDDCSPDEYRPYLERVAAMDPRIRVIRQDVNGGTYVIRNRALHEAKGRFFTVQDSDDWSHPARIERQVHSLMAVEGLVAVHCKGIRTNDQLILNYPGVAPIRTNESSLLFERDPVVSRIGYYDESRKGADTEYSRRLKAAFPSGYLELPEILTAIRLSHGSLSRAEFKPGWRHPARAIYSRAFERWHSKFVAGQASAYLPREQKVRHFHVPTRFLVRATDVEREARVRFDWLLAGDFRGRSPDALRLVDAMHALCKSGRRVGYLQLDSFRHLGRQAVEPFPDDFIEVARWHGVQEVSLTDNLSVGAMVFASAEGVQFRPGLPGAIRAKRSFILVNVAKNSDAPPLFDVGSCINNVYAMSSAVPTWVPWSSTAREVLDRRIPPHHLSQHDWPHFVSPQIWRVPTREFAAAHALGIVCTGVSGEVFSVMGDMGGAPERGVQVWQWTEEPPSWLDVHKIPSHWTVKNPITSSWGGYLGEVGTVLLGGRCPDAQDRLPAYVLQMLAAGCVVIADASWERLLYNAALYAPPELAAAMAAKVEAIPAHWRALSDAAKHFATQHNDEAKLLSILDDIGGY